MRSDNWDEKEKRESNEKMPRRGDPRFHDHVFLENGRCAYCRKTREEIRKSW